VGDVNTVGLRANVDKDLAEDVDYQIPSREKVVVGRVFTQGESEREADGAEGLEPGELEAFVAAVRLVVQKGLSGRVSFSLALTVPKDGG
jgi:hypothetical protein